MLKFNKKTEYGLIALRYMASQEKPEAVVSAREISEVYHIPYPVMSKVMQTLNSNGIIDSLQGTRGGYRIHTPLNNISLAQIVKIFQGPIEVTDCLGKGLACALRDACNVRTIFHTINQKLSTMLEEINLGELEESADGHNFLSQGSDEKVVPACSSSACKQKDK